MKIFVAVFSACFLLFGCSAVPVVEESRVILSPLIKQLQISQVWQYNLESTSQGCACQGESCSCCTHLKVKQIHWDAEVCVKVKLIPADMSLQVSLLYNQQVIFKKTISAKHPPKMCANYSGVTACVGVTDVHFEAKSFDACIDLSAKAFGFKVVDVKIGCFKIPIPVDKLSLTEGDKDEKILYLN